MSLLSLEGLATEWATLSRYNLEARNHICAQVKRLGIDLGEFQNLADSLRETMQMINPEPELPIGSYNVAIGHSALQHVTTGSHNTCFGVAAAFDNNIGSN